MALARSLRTGGIPLAPAMALKGKGFERRLRAVLSPSRASSVLPGALAASGLFAFALVLAAAHPTSAAVIDEPVSVHPHVLVPRVDQPDLVADVSINVAPRLALQIDTAVNFKLDQVMTTRIRELQGSAAMLAMGLQAAGNEGEHGGDGDDDEADEDHGQDHARKHSLLGQLRNRLLDDDDWYDRAMEQHREGRYQQAIELWQRAISHDERKDAASYNIACAYARLGESGRAIEWLRKAQGRGFNLEHYVLRDDDLDSLRTEQPFKELLQELRSNPDSELRARADRASRKLDKLLVKQGGDAGSLNQAAKELLNTGEYAKAAKAFHEAAARSGSPAACAEALGGDKEAALRSLRAAVDAGWDDAEHIKTDSDLSSLRGDPRFTELRKSAKALALPSSGHGFWSIFSRKGDERRWKDATQHYEELTSKDPKSGAAWFKLGYARLAANDAAGAGQAFSRALDLGFRKPTTLYNLACAEARQDHKDRAFEYLDKAIAAGFDAAGQLRSDEDLDNLRGDSRLRDLLRKAKTAQRDEDEDD